MKSVVVEIKNDFAAVLSDDGSIVKVKNQNYVVGQEIIMKNQKVHMTKKFALCAASAAALVLFGGTGAWAYSAPYSYVSLDVNPSIEYTLNRFDTVIGVEAVNDDGQSILDDINIKELTNTSIENAIINTVEQISEEGYFIGNTTDTATATPSTSPESDQASAPIESASPTSTSDTSSIDGGIIITVASENTSVSEELTSVINEAVETVVEDTVEVEVVSVGYDRVTEAKALGMTPGKLNLIEKLQASSSTPDAITVEEWKDKSVKEIMKAIKANRKAAASTEETQDSTSTDPTITEEVKDANLETEEADDKESVKESDDDAKSEEVKAEEVKAEKAKEKAEKAAEKAKVKEEKATEKAKAEQEKAAEKAKKQEEIKKEQAKKQQELEKAKEEKAEEKANKAKDKEESSEKKNDTSSSESQTDAKSNGKSNR